MQSLDGRVVGYGVESCREVEEDQGRQFSSVEEGVDVSGSDPGGLNAVVG